MRPSRPGTVATLSGINASGIVSKSPYDVVKILRNVPGYFYMLPLILSDGDPVGGYDQYVGRHQDRIGKKSMIGRNPLLRLIFIGVAALEQSHGRNRRQDPLEFTHLGHIALQIYGAPVRVQP